MDAWSGKEPARALAERAAAEGSAVGSRSWRTTFEETDEGRTAQLEASGQGEDLSPDAVSEELDQRYAVR